MARTAGPGLNAPTKRTEKASNMPDMCAFVVKKTNIAVSCDYSLSIHHETVDFPSYTV